MAKEKDITLFVGIALVIIGLIGLGRLISILLVVFGGYLIYKSLKKRK